MAIFAVARSKGVVVFAGEEPNDIVDRRSWSCVCMRERQCVEYGWSFYQAISHTHDGSIVIGGVHWNEKRENHAYLAVICALHG